MVPRNAQEQSRAEFKFKYEDGMNSVKKMFSTKIEELVCGEGKFFHRKKG